jgi:hypothetical protein
VSRDGSHRRDSLLFAANLTGLEIAIPHQPVWTDEDIESIKCKNGSKILRASALAWLGHLNALKWYGWIPFVFFGRTFTEAIHLISLPENTAVCEAVALIILSNGLRISTTDQTFCSQSPLTLRASDSQRYRSRYWPRTYASLISYLANSFSFL